MVGYDEDPELGQAGVIGDGGEGGRSEQAALVLDGNGEALTGLIGTDEAARFDGERAPTAAEEPIAQVRSGATLMRDERLEIARSDRAEADDPAVGVECVNSWWRTDVHSASFQ